MNMTLTTILNSCLMIQSIPLSIHISSSWTKYRVDHNKPTTKHPATLPQSYLKALCKQPATMPQWCRFIVAHPVHWLGGHRPIFRGFRMHIDALWIRADPENIPVKNAGTR